MGRHFLDEGATGRRVDQLEEFVASLKDALDALNAKVDEAIAAAQGAKQAVEERIAAEITATTARLHDGIVSPVAESAPEVAQEPADEPATAVDPSPVPAATAPEVPGAAGWRPGQ